LLSQNPLRSKELNSTEWDMYAENTAKRGTALNAKLMREFGDGCVSNVLCELYIQSRGDQLE